MFDSCEHILKTGRVARAVSQSRGSMVQMFNMFKLVKSVPAHDNVIAKPGPHPGLCEAD
jgi:hypothetical protein